MHHTTVGSEAARLSRSTSQDPGTQGAEVSATDLGQVLTRVTTARLPRTAVGLVSMLKVVAVLINALTALQARVQAALLTVRRDEAEQAGRSLRPVRGAVTREIGLACRTSPYLSAQSLKRSLTVPARLPLAWERWVAGELTEERVAGLVRESRHLDQEAAARVDQAVSPQLGKKSKKEADHLIRTAVVAADPATAAERARRALEDRYASARPAGEGMISLQALLPGLEGQAVWTGLEQRAGVIRGTGDQRSKDQIKADLLVEGLISYLTYLEDSDDASGTQQKRKRPRPAVQVQLVMTDASLLGHSETAARAHGLGPVPAPVAREWAREAVEEERAELIRLWTRPGTGKLVAMDSKRRLFPTSLARYITTRDHLCRTPWCGAPIRQLDHVIPHARGGATSSGNAQGLCVQCNEHKDNPGWHHVPGAGGAVTITTPTGDIHTSTPEELPHETEHAA